MSNIKL